MKSSPAPNVRGRILADDTADAIIEAALAHAAVIALPVSIAIVDAAGLLVRFTRQTGAMLVSLTMAQDKAYTAAAFGIATHEWINFIKDDQQLLHGIPPYPRLVIIGGGYPVALDGTLVGGIGVSGGHYRQDMEVALAGLAVLDTIGNSSKKGSRRWVSRFI